MYHPTRGGVRGGRDQFNWDDIKGDKHRENYLGHSIKAPVGRWQKGKDLHWYAKDRHSDEAAALEEIKRLQEDEHDAMQEMLGLAPKKNRRQINQMDTREMSEVLKKVKDGVESDPSYAAGERVQGLGFAGQATPHQPGSGQTGADKSGNVTFVKISPVIKEQKHQESSGDEGNRGAKKDGLEIVLAQGTKRLESEEKTSSSSSEEEGISHRKRKREKRREEKKHKHKRKKGKARESEQEELSDSYHGDARNGRRKARYASKEVKTSRGNTEGNAVRPKDQSKDYHLATDRRNDMVTSRHDRESLQETNRTTSRREYRSLQNRDGKARDDSDNEDNREKLQETVRRTSTVDYRSHHSRNLKLRHDSDNEESQERLQSTVRISRQDSISQHSRHVKKRHDNDSDSEDSQGRLQETVGTTRRDYRSQHIGDGKVRHDSGREGSQRWLQETVRAPTRDHKSHDSRDGHGRHDREKETKGRRDHDQQRSFTSNQRHSRRRHDSD